MPLGPNALTTWERAKSVLHFADEQETVVEFLIDAVSASANRIAARALKARAYPALTLDGPRGDTLLLPEYPIVELRHIWVDDARIFAVSTELLAGEYQLRKDDGAIRLYSGRFPVGPDVIKLDITLGYDSVPEDLELAVLECVLWNSRRLESGTVGTRALSTDGSVTAQYEVTIPMSALTVFESYRSPHA